MLNAIAKITQHDQQDKIIANNILLITVGILLLIATALFLHHKTIHIGAAFLVVYMTLIVSIHIYKGKPYEVAMLMIVCIAFASYIRKPEIFTRK